MKKKGKKRGGFDRSKVNTNFFGNSKANKDNVAGWAFDFDNPDAGQVGSGNKGDDDAIMQQVMADSLKDGQPNNSDDKPKDGSEDTEKAAETPS